ncbi:unnamed protein product [Clonostachys byssicola]|uniref:Uncharacterized protein n=1 Tax=Clonostachys byssicola TaxID=160290 RepID=A0A9N9UKY6_9HYPO|nr:unnamed protein product [Clonostachys byssicola]
MPALFFKSKQVDDQYPKRLQTDLQQQGPDRDHNVEHFDKAVDASKRGVMGAAISDKGVRYAQLFCARCGSYGRAN